MDETIVVHQDEDGVWVVEHPSIPGCVSQGRTRNEALENLEDAILGCLEARETLGFSSLAETSSRMNDVETRLNSIDWTQFETAYGAATRVPEFIRQLWSSDEKVAFEATHQLWCGLCHQHVFVSSAALPAFPFLLDALLFGSDAMKEELMDIFLGFARCTSRSTEAEWERRLRLELQVNSHHFRVLTTHSNVEIADFASWTLEELRLKQPRSS
jgi:predicted RNase H-like HicB family nuclease